ncbi:MAG: hypothetical protein LBS81_00125 [Endomicrobium sp.]|nr:hypothetical protein [Endomicrobium sp.]
MNIFIYGIVNFINPDTIILCGGITYVGKYFTNSSLRKIRKSTFRSAVAKACKNNPCIIGAANAS